MMMVFSTDAGRVRGYRTHGGYLPTSAARASIFFPALSRKKGLRLCPPSKTYAWICLGSLKT